MQAETGQTESGRTESGRTASSRVTSNQRQIHPKLPILLRRYLANSYRKPVTHRSQASFAGLVRELTNRPRPVVLDSFCGTGHSTAVLAQRHPHHLVVGIDKSAHRLAKRPEQPDNSILLHAECEDVWQLLLQQGIAPDYHYLLYPNPWPKAGHLQRRIHGSPAVRLLLELGGRVELRSNWQLYVEEFGLAMNLAGNPGRIHRVALGEPITLFERKYQASGHELWSYAGHLQRPAP